MSDNNQSAAQSASADPALFLSNFFLDVEEEVERARGKFPDTAKLSLAMTEEFGEVVKALLDQEQKPEKGLTSREVYEEIVQAAAMAARLATEGDTLFPKYKPQEV